MLTIFSGCTQVSSERGPKIEYSAHLAQTGLELAAKAPPQHHFNLQAPYSLSREGAAGAIAPSRLDDHEVQYKIPNPDKARFHLGLYLCDDAKTFCQRRTVEVYWDEKASQFVIQPLLEKEGDSKKASFSAKGSQAPSQSVAQSASQAASQAAGQNLGFRLNQPEEALQEAAKTGKPLLIDFFGIWCPPCNELDEEVFSSGEFQIQSKDFVRLKLDVDQALSWKLKSKYKVGGYPTIVFASADGEEIDRIVGFRDKKVFLKQMKEVFANRQHPLSQDVAAAQAGNRQAMDRLGAMHLERKEYTQAAELLAKSIEKRELYFEARIGALEASSKEHLQELLSVLRESIQEFPDTPESIDRRLKLADLYQQSKQVQERKQVLQQAITVARKLLLKTPEELEEHDVSKADLWQTISQAYEDLEDSTQAKESWRSAVAEYRKKIKSGQERSSHLEMAYCLWKSGQFAAAEEIYQKFEKLFPDEFTFFYSHASMKMSQKNFQEAQRLAQKASEFSYGDNQLRVSLLLAKALMGQGKKGEAREVVHKVLGSASQPEDAGIRTHHYLKQLQELAAELATEQSSGSAKEQGA